MTSTRLRSPRTLLTSGTIVLDTGARTLAGPDGTSELTVGAYAVLRALMLRSGEVLTTDELIEERWCGGLEPAHAESAIRTAVSRARDAIGAVGGAPDLLRSVPGVGYRLDGGQRLLCACTPEAFTALKRMVATHPDRELAAELTPFLDPQPCVPDQLLASHPDRDAAAALFGLPVLA